MKLKQLDDRPSVAFSIFLSNDEIVSVSMTWVILGLKWLFFMLLGAEMVHIS